MGAASVYFASFVLSSGPPAGTLRFDSGHRPHRAQIRAVAVDKSGEAVDVREDPSSTSETVDGSGDIFIAGNGNNQVVKWAPGASEGVVWAANKRFEVSKFKFKFPRARTYELIRARSRLYRSQFLQVNTRWKALAEIYTMHSFAPFFNLKI